MNLSMNVDLFRAAILSAGLSPPEIIEPGKLHRFSTNGKRHDDAGWLKFFEDGQGGVYGDFRSGLSETWQAERAKSFTSAERESFRRRCEAECRAREGEKARCHAEAAKKAGEVLADATGDPAGHPYAIRKKVGLGSLVRRGPWRQRGLTDALLVPLYDSEGCLWSVEAIDADGDKDFLKGSKTSGCFYPFGEVRGASRVLVSEGLANAAVGVAADGSPAVAALCASNLKTVALSVRKLAPEALIVILADNDVRPDGSNPGLKAAEEAAASCGARVAVPEIDGDFWDLWHERGDEAVRDHIYKAEPPEDPIPPLDKRPCFRVFDEWIEHQDGRLSPGVWHFGVNLPKKPNESPVLTQRWICSPLYVDAVAEDGQDNNYGRLLRFRNTLGRWREWCMPQEMLKGYGDELRGELLAMGTEINPVSKALFAQYLPSVHPKRSVRCAMQVGWCGDKFVLPDAVIGAGASEVIFQSGERLRSEYTCGGTFAGWKAEIAARAVGNHLLVQTISGSFCGPLLMRCVAEGGGIHFVGNSSIGKTAAVKASCSTWGGANFRRSWKATANGMEGAAALCNDGLLALDEIKECAPRDIDAIVYALTNGLGKQRASRTGSARPVTHWRCFVLSSGEMSIVTRLEEGGYRAMAGQSVRLLDVPVLRGKFEAWNNLHGFPSGAVFSDALMRSALTHYGHAGRAFLEKLTRDTRNFSELLERIKALPAFSIEGGEGQDKRAAARFALMALAGELATEYGITGWEEGTATDAAAAGLKAWRSLRGPRNDERRQILEAVSSFIERHGDSRFSSAEEENRYGRDGENLGPDPRVGAEAVVRDRAGWWRDDGDERIYLFHADGMREALKGFDFNPALTVLQDAGALPASNAGGVRSTTTRIGGRKVRVYEIHPDKLEAPHGP